MKLRFLQTTDLHMHLLPFNYGTMQPSTRRGLANLASQIEAFKTDKTPTLLFDTGDFLQGTPLADSAALSKGEHPIAKAFNMLGYDAIALGNHDFDYGLEKLDAVISEINCPVLTSNVGLKSNSSHFAGTALIDVDLDPHHPGKQLITVGVIGITTPVTSFTNSHGQDLITATDPIHRTKTIAAKLKQDGANLVVALCHFGIDLNDPIENVADDIAALHDIDIVMAGHTHETFPQGTPHAGPMIDSHSGTIHGKPMIAAGAYGSHLGVIELTAKDTPSGIKFTSHIAKVIAAEDCIQRPNHHFFTAAEPLHAQTLAYMRECIAETKLPISTVFSLIQPDLSQYLLSCARQLHMEKLFAGTKHAALPFLTTAAPFRTGSTFDTSDFLHIPAGQITRRDIAAIYPFNNSAVALQRNGAQIKDWLEGSALLFTQIEPGRTDQNLINPRVPPYRFDTIFGLTYTIDVSRPAGHKIQNLAYRGKAVTDQYVFALVTTTNRLADGQNIPPSDILGVASATSQDMLADSLRRQSPVTTPCPHVWDFAPIQNTKAFFSTSAAADPSLCDRDLTDEGIRSDGFRKFSLNFDTSGGLARR